MLNSVEILISWARSICITCIKLQTNLGVSCPSTLSIYCYWAANVAQRVIYSCTHTGTSAVFNADLRLPPKLFGIRWTFVGRLKTFSKEIFQYVAIELCPSTIRWSCYSDNWSVLWKEFLLQCEKFSHFFNPYLLFSTHKCYLLLFQPPLW